MTSLRNILLAVLILAFAQVGLRQLWGIGLYLVDMSSVSTVPAVIEEVESVTDRIPGAAAGRADSITRLVGVRFSYEYAGIPKTANSISLLCGPCESRQVSDLFQGEQPQTLQGRKVTAYVSAFNPDKAYLFLVEPRAIAFEALKAIAWIAASSIVVLLMGRAFLGRDQSEEDPTPPGLKQRHDIERERAAGRQHRT